MQTGRRIDWAMMLLNLRNQGLSLCKVAKSLGIPINTLRGWFYEGREPLYSSGELFVNFYCRQLKVGNKDLPRC